MVSDKQTGDDKPGNNDTHTIAGIFEWLEQETGVPEGVWVAIVIAFIVIAAVTVLSAVFPPVAQAVLWVLKALWWLISAPFKGIAALIERAKVKK